MNEIIRKRRSIRKYDPAKLDTASLEKVRAKIKDLKPLFAEINYHIEITDKVKRAIGINAPHYLMLNSEEKEGFYENIGFIGQQLDLFFSAEGIGSCWVGMAKPEKSQAAETALPYVISIAFGKPAEPLHRNLSEFKRKPLSAISEGSDERLEAARLAPSGVNSQNWYFAARDGNIHCYRKKAISLLGNFMNKLACIDLGIAICHLAEESKDFRFEKQTGVPERKGFVYTGTVAGR